MAPLKSDYKIAIADSSTDDDITKIGSNTMQRKLQHKSTNKIRKIKKNIIISTDSDSENERTSCNVNGCKRKSCPKFEKKDTKKARKENNEASNIDDNGVTCFNTPSVKKKSMFQPLNIIRESTLKNRKKSLKKVRANQIKNNSKSTLNLCKSTSKPKNQIIHNLITKYLINKDDKKTKFVNEDEKKEREDKNKASDSENSIGSEESEDKKNSTKVSKENIILLNKEEIKKTNNSTVKFSKTPKQETASEPLNQSERERQIVPGSHTYAIFMTMYKHYLKNPLEKLLTRKNIIKMQEKDTDCKIYPLHKGKLSRALHHFSGWSKYSNILINKKFIKLEHKKYVLAYDGIKFGNSLCQSTSSVDDDFHRNVEHTLEMDERLKNVPLGIPASLLKIAGISEY